jgi:hypothetical protein
VDPEEVLDLDAIDGHHLRSAALRLEAEPAVPGADVEHAAAAQVGRQGKPGVAALEDFEGVVAFDADAAGQFEAVIPALFGQLLAKIPAAARWSRWKHRSIVACRAVPLKSQYAASSHTRVAERA